MPLFYKALSWVTYTDSAKTSVTDSSLIVLEIFSFQQKTTDSFMIQNNDHNLIGFQVA